MELEDYKEKARVRWSTPKATTIAIEYFGSLTRKASTTDPAGSAQISANQRKSAQPSATQRNPAARLFQTLGPEPQSKDSTQTLSPITMEVAKGLLSTNSKPTQPARPTRRIAIPDINNLGIQDRPSTQTAIQSNKTMNQVNAGLSRQPNVAEIINKIETHLYNMVSINDGPLPRLRAIIQGQLRSLGYQQGGEDDLFTKCALNMCNKTFDAEMNMFIKEAMDKVISPSIKEGTLAQDQLVRTLK